MPGSFGKKLLLLLTLINIIFASAFIVWQNWHEKQSVIEQMKLEGRGIYHYVVLTRQLISRWKGIYVKSDNSLERKTPSGFTKALADLGASRGAPFSLKMAFAGNTDPDHAPDSFEKNAIRQMKQGKTREAWEIVRVGNHRHFKYAGPLIFDADCATCHAGTRKSGVIGCITVTIKADPFFSALVRKHVYTAFYLAGAFGLITLLLWGLLNRYVLSPLDQLERAALRVEKGDLGVRVDLDQAREWQSVGQNFNNMVMALERQQATMKQEISKAVSRMESAYNELKKTEQYKSDFFTNITHDLKTPITAMQGALNLLERNCEIEDKTYIDILKRNCSKLATMVQAILDSARLESGMLDLQTEEADLNELVEDAILMAMPLAWEKKIEIQYRVPEKPSMAFFDSARLEQVMTNLLSNAVKFSPEGSRIDVKVLGIRVAPEKLEDLIRLHGNDCAASGNNSEKISDKQAEAGSRRFWLVTVSDTGQGIPEDRLDLVFEKFYHRGAERGKEGLGLGLAIVRGIIEMHGGKTGVVARRESGACFWFAIPSLNYGNVAKQPQNSNAGIS